MKEKFKIIGEKSRSSNKYIFRLFHLTFCREYRHESVNRGEIVCCYSSFPLSMIACSQAFNIIDITLGSQGNMIAVSIFHPKD